MKKERYHSNDLKRLILKNKMSTMVEMKEVMGTKVDATIFRKLRELHYLRSYSHRGKYYTVPEVVRFDAKELWSCRAVHFSKQGSLLNAIAHHVDRSVSGYFEYEIESLLHVTVRVAVLKLLKENRISRQKVAGRYLYCSSRMRKRNRQYNDRKKHQIIKDSTLESMSSEMMFQEGKTLVELFLSLLDEKQRRLFAGLESIKLGYGGDKKIAHLFGLDMHTVAKGRKELCRGEIETDKVRRVGGGRKFLEKKRRKSSP
ncbi:MAG: hypothetical protein K8R17_08070 [Methanosarcinales archaeon]|jgi:hypothetical protein|nr:hypothetical protein [Methanosarcinales archaeon]